MESSRPALSVSVFGTRIGVGLPFLLVVLVYMLCGLGREALVALMCVAAHELAHLLVACAYDIEIESCELTPFGGVARYAGFMEQDPYTEISVALAGPASSFALAGLGTVLWWAGWFAGSIPVDLVGYNLLLGALNLFPALPLDGGRVLRALFQKRLGFRDATYLACRIGRWAASFALVAGVLIALFGIFTPGPFVLAYFLRVHAVAEQRRASLAFVSLLIRKKTQQSTRRTLRLNQVCAPSDLTLTCVARQFSLRRFSVIGVLDEQHNHIGSVSESQVIEAILSGHGEITLGELLSRLS